MENSDSSPMKWENVSLRIEKAMPARHEFIKLIAAFSKAAASGQCILMWFNLLRILGMTYFYQNWNQNSFG